MVAVDICNLALSYLGDSATVTSIAPPDGSAQAQHCARFYPVALGVLLEAHAWSFITKRVTLALLTTPYSDAWQNAYAVPADVSTILNLLPASTYACTGQNWRSWTGTFDFEANSGLLDGRDYQLETDDQNRQVLLSNLNDAVLRYTGNQVQSGLFPALFTDALAWKVASMLAGPLLKGDTGAAESKRCMQMSAAMLAQAMSHDANQQRSAPRPQPVWMRNR